MINLADVQMQLQRAQGLYQARRVAEAWTAIAPLRAAIADHGQGLRLFALVAQAAGQVDPAADALRRIIAIEREPPEIVGALADLLGKAGRHDEALTLWTRLVALHPHVADAHLNRAVTAANAGQHELAVAAATKGLARFPGNARLLATKAMALKNAGRIEESLSLFEAAVAADPDRAMTRHNQGVALRAACRFDEACEAFAASARLGMAGAQFHANWAAAALEGERIDEAIDQYRRALADDPTHPESRVGLTRLQIEYRDGVDAFAHYEHAATSRNQLADWMEYANILMAHRRNADAAEVAGRAVGRFGPAPELIAAQAYAAGIDGDAPAALREIEQAFAGRSDPPLASMAMLALRAGDAGKAAALAERITALNPDDQGAWSVLSI
ncbi:MAG TPA: tetratricopeptide repeat protein, partial [Sphingomicrobium sp.]|nr:tetratricopeptide repeat protein [Sphingomicrobium sp.]